MVIKKKIWPDYFNEVLLGTKTYEYRLNDFQCSPGDELVLEEYDPKTKEYTGRSLSKKIVGISRFTLKELLETWPQEDIEKYGFQIISIK